MLSAIQNLRFDLDGRAVQQPLTVVLALALLATLGACDSSINCEVNDDCPVDRICGDEGTCIVPGSDEPEAETPGPNEPGVGEPSTPSPEAEGCGNPPCFLMPDSETAACEDTSGFPDDCPAEGEEGYGQDGTTVGPLTQYSFVAGGIQDDVNGIVWQEGHSTDEMPHANAVTFCEELEDGQRQWRLPTIRELYAILDFGRDPTVNAAFLRPADGVFHTSSNAAATNLWYAVNLEEAFRGSHTVGAVGNAVAYTKCVSGPSFGGANFVRVGDPSDNVAMDVQTGIFLQYVANESDYWGEALEFCDALSLGGDDDWRLATAKDLVLILDPPDIATNRAVHPFFSVTPNEVWTSTVANDNEHKLNQISGRIDSASPSNARGFYCARGPNRIPVP